MDTAATALKSLTGAFRVFGKDLEALPEEAFSKSFGGSARTVADIAYEVNLVNEHVRMTIAGEKPFDWPEDEGWITAPKGFRAKDEVLGAFRKSSEKVLATVEGFSPEEMERTVQTEHGERTKFDRCQFMTLHLWYHSGQLNFIQTLLGDSDWHW